VSTATTRAGKPGRQTGPPRGGEKVSHPSGDERFAMIDADMKRHRYQQDALIEVLHTAQELFGCLKPDLLLYVAHGLKLPPSRVYGVATFYHLFTLTPRGEHTCVVCTGTACYVKGADELLVAIERATGAHSGQTMTEGRISLETARCLGSCGIAPVVVFDGAVCGKQTPNSVVERVGGWIGHGAD
jgi:bidirectional [NiFe] hydrogenase diaphorase subunit